MSDDRKGRFFTHIASGRRSSECTIGWWLAFAEEFSLLDFGELVELVSRDVDELEELLLLRDLDLDGDRLLVLPDGEGDLDPDLDFVFFFEF